VSSAPCCASCQASSSPMPEDAPVMSATLPRKLARVLIGSSPRNGQAARTGRPCEECLECTGDVREISDADEIRGAVEADEIAHPGKHRHVGNSVGIAHEPAAPLEAQVEHAQQPLRFCDVAIARALVGVFAASELVEEAE